MKTTAKKTTTKPKVAKTKKTKVVEKTKEQVKKTSIRYLGLLNMTYNTDLDFIKCYKKIIVDLNDKKKSLVASDELNSILGESKKSNSKLAELDKRINNLTNMITDYEKRMEEMEKSPKSMDIFDYIDKDNDVPSEVKYKLGTRLIKVLMENFGDKGYGEIDYTLRLSDYNTKLYLNGRLVESVDIYYTAEFSDDPSWYKWFSLTLRGKAIDDLCENIDRNSKEFKLIPYQYIKSLRDSIYSSNCIKYKYFGSGQDFKDPDSYKVECYKIFHDDVVIGDGYFQIENLNGVLWLCKLLGVTL